MKFAYKIWYLDEDGDPQVELGTVTAANLTLAEDRVEDYIENGLNDPIATFHISRANRRGKWTPPFG